MLLQGIDVGFVFRQAARGDFFGEKQIVAGGIFITPPVTLEVRQRDYFRRIYFFRGAVIATNDFASPGAQKLFEQEKWQKRTDPFILSFASVSVTPPARKREIEGFADLLKKHHQSFRARMCIELNVFNCVNVANNGRRRTMGDMEQEIEDSLNYFGVLEIPCLVRVDAFFPLVVAKAIDKHPACDGFVVANPIPWHAFPDRPALEHFFGKRSPLERAGGGAISGTLLTPLIRKWVLQASSYGLRKPIIAGGCFSRADIESMFNVGASAVLLDEVRYLRPWRVKAMITYANKCGSAREERIKKVIRARFSRIAAEPL